MARLISDEEASEIRKSFSTLLNAVIDVVNAQFHGTTKPAPDKDLTPRNCLLLPYWGTKRHRYAILTHHDPQDPTKLTVDEIVENAWRFVTTNPEVRAIYEGLGTSFSAEDRPTETFKNRLIHLIRGTGLIENGFIDNDNTMIQFAAMLFNAKLGAMAFLEMRTWYDLWKVEFALKDESKPFTQKILFLNQGKDVIDTKTGMYSIPQSAYRQEIPIEEIPDWVVFRYRDMVEAVERLRNPLDLSEHDYKIVSKEEIEKASARKEAVTATKAEIRRISGRDSGTFFKKFKRAMAPYAKLDEISSDTCVMVPTVPGTPIEYIVTPDAINTFFYGKGDKKRVNALYSFIKSAGLVEKGYITNSLKLKQFVREFATTEVLGEESGKVRVAGGNFVYILIMMRYVEQYRSMGKKEYIKFIKSSGGSVENGKVVVTENYFSYPPGLTAEEQVKWIENLFSYYNSALNLIANIYRNYPGLSLESIVSTPIPEQIEEMPAEAKKEEPVAEKKVTKEEIISRIDEIIKEAETAKVPMRELERIEDILKGRPPAAPEPTVKVTNAMGFIVDKVIAAIRSGRLDAVFYPYGMWREYVEQYSGKNVKTVSYKTFLRYFWMFRERIRINDVPMLVRDQNIALRYDVPAGYDPTDPSMNIVLLTLDRSAISKFVDNGPVISEIRSKLDMDLTGAVMRKVTDKWWKIYYDESYLNVIDTGKEIEVSEPMSTVSHGFPGRMRHYYAPITYKLRMDKAKMTQLDMYMLIKQLEAIKQNPQYFAMGYYQLSQHGPDYIATSTSNKMLLEKKRRQLEQHREYLTEYRARKGAPEKVKRIEIKAERMHIAGLSEIIDTLSKSDVPADRLKPDIRRQIDDLTFLIIRELNRSKIRVLKLIDPSPRKPAEYLVGFMRQPDEIMDVITKTLKMQLQIEFDSVTFSKREGIETLTNTQYGGSFRAMYRYSVLTIRPVVTYLSRYPVLFTMPEARLAILPSFSRIRNMMPFVKGFTLAKRNVDVVFHGVKYITAKSGEIVGIESVNYDTDGTPYEISMFKSALDGYEKDISTGKTNRYHVYYKSELMPMGEFIRMLIPTPAMLK